MDTAWTIITIIGSTVVATGSVLGIYFNHKSKNENRIKELEIKVGHHEKFISILEKKALKALDHEFKDKETLKKPE
ncbi:MAG: hypothetical protein RLP15_11500 [Cryomorphaceae bacterium]